jgi:UDP-galactopyranose mutase
MVTRMLEPAEVRLGVDWLDIQSEPWEHAAFTGSLDEYFGCKLGRLPYRSLRFEFMAVAKSWIPRPASIAERRAYVPDAEGACRKSERVVPAACPPGAEGLVRRSPLGTYRYWNMDQFVANGLSVANVGPVTSMGRRPIA